MAHLRITGGTHRGRRLKVPPGLGVRPTSDRVKQALFNILGPQVVGARVLDLFAGSGALGLEALSRGAGLCLFVENHPRALAALRENLAALGMDSEGRVLDLDVRRALPALKREGPFDLVLADPPYEKGLVAAALSAAAAVLVPGGILVVEHSPGEPPGEVEGLRLYDQRGYGQTRLSYLERTAQATP